MDTYTIGEWVFDSTASTLSKNGDVKHIEPKCNDLLLMLIKAEGQVVPRQAIMDALWDGRYVSEHALNNLVGMLRRHLKDDSNFDYIQTKPKRGYCLPIRVIEPAENKSLDNQATVPPCHETNPKQNHRWLLIAIPIALIVITLIVLGNQNVGITNTSPSIAVMPFEILDDSLNVDNMAQGLVEETIYSLSSSTELRVLPKSILQANTIDPANFNEYSQAIGADYYIEGAIRKQHNLLRITARLIQGQSGNQLWAESFTGNVEKTFEWQSRVSEQITALVNDSFDNPDELELLETSSVPFAARLHLLRGRKLNGSGNMEDYVLALDEFKMATSLAPNYWEAHLDLALNYLILAQRRVLPVEDMNRKAYESIDNALKLVPNNAQTNALLGTYYQNTEQPEKAEQAFKRALTLEPELYIATINYANLLRANGRFEESLALYQKALKQVPTSRPAMWAQGELYLLLGQFNQAHDSYETCTQVLANYDACYASLAYIQRLFGQHSNAQQTYQNYTKLTDESSYWARLSRAWQTLWENNGDAESANLYQAIIADYGLSIDGLYVITMAKWRSGQLDSWQNQLIEAQNNDNSGAFASKYLAAIGYSQYLMGNCTDAIHALEALYAQDESAFKNFELYANAVSYSLMLSACYDTLNDETKRNQYLAVFDETINAIDTAQTLPLGIHFLMAQYALLTNDSESFNRNMAEIEQDKGLIGWMTEHDPIFNMK